MQGSYKNNGLPRPYYMKPAKRGSVYDKMPRQAFLTNSRKLSGYIVMLFLFGLCIFLVSQELKTAPETSFEIIGSNKKISSDKNSGDVGKFVDSAKAADSENEKLDLSLNQVQNPKGEYGHAVMEAPKGGMVNEAHIVGNDEDLLLDGKPKKSSEGRAPPQKGFKATREKDGNSENGDSNKIKSDKSAAGSTGSEAGDKMKKIGQESKKQADAKKILEESDNQ